MPNSNEETIVHRREIRRRFDRHEIRRLLAEIAARDAGIADLSGSGIDFKVEFHDETEGSPSYRVGIRAVVSITQELSAAEASA
jgi:hypothetical protein